MVPGEKKKVKSKRMKAPHMSLVYNGTMWTVDVDDFQALNDGTSWERGCQPGLVVYRVHGITG